MSDNVYINCGVNWSFLFTIRLIMTIDVESEQTEYKQIWFILVIHSIQMKFTVSNHSVANTRVSDLK